MYLTNVANILCDSLLALWRNSEIITHFPLQLLHILKYAPIGCVWKVTS